MLSQLLAFVRTTCICLVSITIPAHKYPSTSYTSRSSCRNRVMPAICFNLPFALSTEWTEWTEMSYFTEDRHLSTFVFGQLRLQGHTVNEHMGRLCNAAHCIYIVFICKCNLCIHAWVKGAPLIPLQRVGAEDRTVLLQYEAVRTQISFVSSSHLPYNEGGSRKFTELHGWTRCFSWCVKGW